MSISTERESKGNAAGAKDTASPGGEVPVPGEFIMAPPRLRRRPALVAASVAAIAPPCTVGS